MNPVEYQSRTEASFLRFVTSLASSGGRLVQVTPCCPERCQLEAGHFITGGIPKL